MNLNLNTLIILLKFLLLTFIPISYADSNSDKSLTSYQILKKQKINKINRGQLRSDPRLIIVGDFNNNGNHEYLGLTFSKKYTDYVWGSNRIAKKNDKGYWDKGVKLSKDPSWSASFNAHTIGNNNSINGKWNISIEGRQACVHPAQLIPSYFNNDNFIDFLIVCHGYDATPYPGEHSYLMLSKGRNSYRIDKLTDKIGFYHDGATADFNKDGFLDILLTESSSKKLRVYINDGNGKFALKNNYFSQFDSWKAYSTEILDINNDGYFDIFIGGHEDDKYGALPTTILLGNKNNKFSKSNKILIPKVRNYGVVLDIIKHENHLFLVRTGSSPNFYKGTLIQQININDIKNFKTLEKKNMRWLDRIFRLKGDSDTPRFGSLTGMNNDIDFIFDGKEMKLLK